MAQWLIYLPGLLPDDPGHKPPPGTVLTWTVAGERRFRGKSRVTVCLWPHDYPYLVVSSCDQREAWYKTGVLNPRVCLPLRPGGPVTVECPDHGPMTWRELAWRCGQCPASVTEADMARLARWLGGERFDGADCGRA